MNEQKNYAIGVDLGGTNTVFGIVDAQGNIVAQDSIKTQAYSTAEAFVEAVRRCLASRKTESVFNINENGISVSANISFVAYEPKTETGAVQIVITNVDGRVAKALPVTVQS